jgi:hypothetical protein
LGYLAQCRYALLASLRELKSHPSHEISIERYDDVAFESEGDPYALIQTKHQTSPGDVTDYSVDLWKTLAIWMARMSTSPVHASSVRLFLLTTATCAEGSALSKLRDAEGNRDEAAALDALITVANSSTNQTTQAARDAFLALDPASQKLLLSNILVFDNAPGIVDVRAEIEAELMLGVPPGKIEPYTEQLEGWWLSRIITCLVADGAPVITFQSILAKMTEIRDEFKADALPLSPEIDSAVGAPATEDDARTFVRQMRLVDLPDGPTSRAVKDYYRAFTQRSLWAREDLLLDEEADRYDRELVDVLERRSDAMAEEAAGADADDQKQLGRKLFHWANNHTHPLRNRHELWLSAGSYQLLADRMVIGWHPDYLKLLEPDGGEP